MNTLKPTRKKESTDLQSEDGPMTRSRSHGRETLAMLDGAHSNEVEVKPSSRQKKSKETKSTENNARPTTRNRSRGRDALAISDGVQPTEIGEENVPPSRIAQNNIAPLTEAQAKTASFRRGQSNGNALPENTMAKSSARSLAHSNVGKSTRPVFVESPVLVNQSTTNKDSQDAVNVESSTGAVSSQAAEKIINAKKKILMDEPKGTTATQKVIQTPSALQKTLASTNQSGCIKKTFSKDLPMLSALAASSATPTHPGKSTFLDTLKMEDNKKLANPEKLVLNNPTFKKTTLQQAALSEGVIVGVPNSIGRKEGVVIKTSGKNSLVITSGERLSRLDQHKLLSGKSQRDALLETSKKRYQSMNLSPSSQYDDKWYKGEIVAYLWMMHKKKEQFGQTDESGKEWTAETLWMAFCKKKLNVDVFTKSQLRAFYQSRSRPAHPRNTSTVTGTSSFLRAGNMLPQLSTPSTHQDMALKVTQTQRIQQSGLPIQTPRRPQGSKNFMNREMGMNLVPRAPAVASNHQMEEESDKKLEKTAANHPSLSTPVPSVVGRDVGQASDLKKKSTATRAVPSTPLLSKKDNKAATKMELLKAEKKEAAEFYAEVNRRNNRPSTPQRKSARRTANPKIPQRPADHEWSDDSLDVTDENDPEVIHKTQKEERFSKMKKDTEKRERSIARAARIEDKKEKELDKQIDKTNKILKKKEEDKERAENKANNAFNREAAREMASRKRLAKQQSIRTQKIQKDDVKFVKQRSNTSKSLLTALNKRLGLMKEDKSKLDDRFAFKIHELEEPQYLDLQMPNFETIDCFNISKFSSEYFKQLNDVFRSDSRSVASNVLCFARKAANLMPEYYFGSVKDPFFEARGFRDLWAKARFMGYVNGSTDFQLATDQQDDQRINAALWNDDVQDKLKLSFDAFSDYEVIESCIEKMRLKTIRKMETAETEHGYRDVTERFEKVEYFVDKYLLLIKMWWKIGTREAVEKDGNLIIANHPRVIQYFFHMMEILVKKIRLDTTTEKVLINVTKLDEYESFQMVKRLLFWLPIHLGNLIDQVHAPRPELVDLARQMFAVLLDEWQFVMGVRPDEREALERLQLAALRLECTDSLNKTKIVDWLPYWKPIDPRGLFGKENDVVPREVKIKSRGRRVKRMTIIKSESQMPERTTRRRCRSFSEFTFKSTADLMKGENDGHSPKSNFRRDWVDLNNIDYKTITYRKSSYDKFF